MDREEDKRRFPRMSTGSDYRARFEIPGHGRVQAMIQNLSACGCGLQVEIRDMAGIDHGSHLDNLFVDHPDIPFVPLEGIVMRVLGKVPGKVEGYALVGVDFHTITPFIRQLINVHILGQLGQA